MAAPLLSISTKEHTFEAQFHPTRALVACATITGEVELHGFDLDHCTEELSQTVTGHKRSCRAAKWMSESILASTGADKLALLSDLETDQQVWRCKLKSAGYCLLPLDDQRFAVGDDDGGLRIFEGRQPKAAVSWFENNDFIADLAMGTDGTSLCAVSGDGTLAVYDIRKSGEKVAGWVDISFSEVNLLGGSFRYQQPEPFCFRLAMADDWQTVAAKPRRQPETRASSSKGVGIDVNQFLSTYKTQPCTEEERHDWFQCRFFHAKGSDKRRDPFEVAYLPDEAGLTGTEKAYHPMNFRTKYCETFCRSGKCKYGAYCAFAHAEDELRQPTKYEEVMKQKLYPSKPRPQVREFLPNLANAVQPPEVLRPERSPDPDPVPHRMAEFLPLTPFEVKVLRHRKMTLWKQLLDVAVEYMCQIHLEESDGVSLKIQGPEQNARSARSKLESQLRPLPKKYGETGTKECSQRVLGLLSDLLKKDGPERFTERKDFELVEIHLDLKKCRVEVCALALPEVTKPMQVFQRIDRWIRDFGYDTTMNCGICMDDFNKHEGVTCVDGHFFCAECLERMLNAQLQSIGSQKGNVLCAMCPKEVEAAAIAKICRKETWKKFQDAVVDARVEAHVQKMQKAFDERLQKKVDELMESYGNEEHSIKLQADKYAQEARNTALNLHCPHCKQVYSEFDGCMALECAHCKKHFCGYCHKAVASSKGQRRFRVKQLKKFFEEKQMKQRIRNATIIELGRDLDDLGGLIAMSDFQDDELLSIVVLRRGTKVICGTQSGMLPIFSWGDFGDQKDRIKGHPMSIDAMVKLDEDGIITGSSDGKLRVVSVHSKSLGSNILGVLTEQDATDYPIERLALSQDGAQMLSTSNGKPSVQLWSTEAARRLLNGESWKSIFEAEAGEACDTALAEEEPDSSDEEAAILGGSDTSWKIPRKKKNSRKRRDGKKKRKAKRRCQVVEIQSNTRRQSSSLACEDKWRCLELVIQPQWPEKLRWVAQISWWKLLGLGFPLVSFAHSFGHPTSPPKNGVAPRSRHGDSMAMSSSSSAQPSGGKDPPQLAERFLLLDDVVAKELSELDYPWNLKAIEERIVEYSSVSEAINLQLSARVMQNYNDFVSGMQMVQSVETELSLIGVLIKNGRRKLQIHDQGILRGSMQITRQHRRRERLKELLSLLDDLQSVVEIHARLCESIDDDRFAEAIVQHSVLRDALASAEYRRFPGVVGLQQSMANNLTLVQQKLSDRLRVSAVSADFDAEKYEEVLKAYSLLASDQAISVGKELLRHVSEFIVAVSRQCMLAFSSRNESPDWHKRAQLRELCKSMDPAHVVACIVQLYEHLCNFLYRHQFLCVWHVCRSQAAEEELAPNEASFRELLRHVHTELVASKRNVWQSLQQQVSLVLMTLDFQYPALSEESFMQILHLTQLLMDEGDAFMARGGS
eukprot:s1308_g11.t1